MKKSTILWIVIPGALLFLLCGGIITFVVIQVGGPMMSNVMALQSDIQKIVPGSSINIGMKNTNGTNTMEVTVAPPAPINDPQAAADAIAAVARKSVLAANSSTIIVNIENRSKTGVVTVSQSQKFSYPMGGTTPVSPTESEETEEDEVGDSPQPTNSTAETTKPPQE